MQHRDIIEKAQKGDVFAFRALINEYKEQAMRLAYSISGNMSDAQDIAQEAFISVYRNIRSFRFNAEFSTWVYRIVVNSCYDFLRKKISSRLVLDENIQEKQAADSQGNTPLGKVLNTELKERINAAVSGLSAKQQIAFDLKYKNGLNSAEIADLMKISVSAVKAHLNRALRILRRKLKPEKLL